jgi:hypothetical protein
MLQSMQPSAVSAPSPKSPSSFAGLLAAFAEPDKKFPPARDVEDDIVTLSYEHALRSQARYRPVEAAPSEVRPRIAQVNPAFQAVVAEPAAGRVTPAPANATSAAPSLLEANLKRASITIRLSQAESAQLHQRAAESGLTVSAYLRSCTLEVENLRAQVKETLAQLRSATASPAQQKPAVEGHGFWSRLWSRFWPRTQRPVRRNSAPSPELTRDFVAKI